MTRVDLERAILGELPHLTLENVVDGTSDDRLGHARQLWRALGFPDPRGAAAFTSQDGAALRSLVDLIEQGRLDIDVAMRLTRAVGATMSRLADWQVGTMSELIEEIEASDRGTGSRLRTGLDFFHELEPTFEQVMMHAWRRHLAAAVGRVEALGAAESDLHMMTATVGFADLVSFTSLSNGIDEHRLAELVEDFENVCTDLVTARGGRVIKTLGDSVLFAAGDAKRAVDIACDIVDQVGSHESLPDVHVGLATGPVVLRLGDIFGPSVNLASRLTGVARRNRVICDDATVQALKAVPGYVARGMTERSLRGFGMVQPFTLRRIHG